MKDVYGTLGQYDLVGITDAPEDCDVCTQIQGLLAAGIEAILDKVT